MMTFILELKNQMTDSGTPFGEEVKEVLGLLEQQQDLNLWGMFLN